MKTKILIIDDEQMFLDTLKMVRWDQELDVIFCNSAVESLELIPVVDGIISDVCMPDSPQLEAALVSIGKKIPIFRMTGNLDYSSENFLAKPFTLRQLKEVMSTIITQHKTIKQ